MFYISLSLWTFMFGVSLSIHFSIIYLKTLLYVELWSYEYSDFYHLKTISFQVNQKADLDIFINFEVQNPEY